MKQRRFLMDFSLQTLRIFALGAIATLFVCCPPAFADSPLTSTNLSVGYDSLKAVQEARKTHEAKGEVLDFLLSRKPLDQKVAVVDALGWSIDGQDNGQRFLDALIQKHQEQRSSFSLDDLKAVDRFLLGYLLAMDHYQDVSAKSLRLDNQPSVSPLMLMSQSAYQLPRNFTVQFVRSLVTGQANFSQDWCGVYVDSAQVLDQFPKAQHTLRKQSLQSATKYLSLYKSACATS